MSRKEWLALGAWGRREEARKTWRHGFSNVIVYSCDFVPREFERHRSHGVEWIPKYRLGDLWLEYHGFLK